VAVQSTYAGVTLDFEGVEPKDQATFSWFVRDLATGLHAEGRILAVAVPAYAGGASRWDGAFDYAAIGPAAAVVAMAYAFRTADNPTPGPISPLPWITDVVGFATSQIPSSRLVLGIGAWGYDWNTTNPGRATTVRFVDVVERVNRGGGAPSDDPINAEASLKYQLAGDNHEIWFEEAESLLRKFSLGEAAGRPAVAPWRLGQEDPGVWAGLAADSPPDYAIPSGWCYTEVGGSAGPGFRVVDGGGRFWSEFQRLGGVATLGYPSSRPYVGPDGFTYQALQRGLLQWRPELGVAYLANAFDMLTADNCDPTLDA
jgi:hypothetical protein